MIKKELFLPKIEKPGYQYSSAIANGNVLWTSGIIPKHNGIVQMTGILGDSISLEEVKQQAEICALQGLAIAASYTGSREKVKQLFKSTCYVACTKNFEYISEIADFARIVMVDSFVENFDYVRSTVGVTRLPANSPVMFDFAFIIG